MRDSDGRAVRLPSLSLIAVPHEKMNVDGSILWEPLMGTGVRSYLLLPYTAPINKKSLRENKSRRLLNDVFYLFKSIAIWIDINKTTTIISVLFRIE